MAVKAYLARCLVVVAVCVCAAGVQARTVTEELKTAPTKNNPVFFEVPDNFDAAKPIHVVVYFHGDFEDETFEHVVVRQRLAEQVAGANMNAVLVAPYFGDVVVSNVGTFGDEDGFSAFMCEAFRHLSVLARTPVQTFAHAPIALIAYSGGYGPAKALFQNNADIESVLLLDAHYGPQKVFVDKAVEVAKSKRGVFVSAYSQDTNYRAQQFTDQLSEIGMSFERSVPDAFAPGMIVQQFVQGKDIHFDFVTKAWAENPITDFLKKTYTARP